MERKTSKKVPYLAVTLQTFTGERLSENLKPLLPTEDTEELQY